ncbi:4'-phosphopantetheinyl transferase family protein [Streptomyces sp. NPDC101118]|uniref:4'-phosphopantetheinyl transferase family protein n=1 Tax=Streptomyces sp. NPDC101118 TaxID=3366109 RepID=UPI0038215082
MGEYELGGDAPGTGPGDRPTGGAVELWRLDTTREVVGGVRVDDGLLAGDGPGLLDAAERSRAARLVRDLDRRRYLAAHVGLRVLLGGYLGVPAGEVAFVREDCPGCGAPHGRPAPAGPLAGTLHFSLSHSGDAALMAFSGRPVGVDVEAVPDAEATADLVETLHPREAAELLALPEEARPPLLGRVWARKEAYLKGTGMGLAKGLRDPYMGTAGLPAPTPGWAVRDVTAPAGFAAAVAVAAAGV